jgi:hypothetical protein
MNVLILQEDLFASSGAAAAFFRLAMPRYPELRFLWPSRGPDLRLRRLGHLPANAAPFAVDRSPELTRIAAIFAADDYELPFAERVVAAAVGLQGMMLDAVDVPSLMPVAHLIRPVFGAVGVGLRRVVEGWMGNPSQGRRVGWPEPATYEADGLEAMEARSAAAVELRYSVATPAPVAGGGPALILPLAALFSPPRPETAVGPMDPSRLLFRGFPDGEGGLDRFIRLGSACKPPPVLYCGLREPDGARGAIRKLAEATALDLGVELNCGSAPVSVCGVAPSATGRFDPAPLHALLHGRPVAVSDRSWTAAALRAEGAAGLAPFVLDSLQSDVELASILDDMRANADAVVAELREGLQGREWECSTITLATVYGETPAWRRVGKFIDLPPDLATAVLEPAHPRRDRPLAPGIAVVVVAEDATATGLAATLASVARQIEPAIELVVVDDGCSDPVDVRRAAEAAGGCARVLRQGRGGAAVAMNRGLNEAEAPIVCFLAASCMAAPELLAEAAALFRRVIEVGAVAPSWADMDAAPGGDIVPAPLTLVNASALAMAWSGPGLTLRRSAALGVGGFDETVGNWAALDLLLRLQAQGDSVLPLCRPARAFRTRHAADRAGAAEALLRVLSKNSKAAVPAWLGGSVV